jgi:phosphohistidine phosphatase
MKLYVMRHGPAEDHSHTGRDADRALTTSGRDRVRSVARALLDEGEAPFHVVSSPLARALQTAEIVAAVTSLDKRAREDDKAKKSKATGAVEVRREMAPGGDELSLVAELTKAGHKRVMIVGHEPDLSMLVSRLVGRTPPQGMLKAMVVGLKLTPTEPGVEGIGITARSWFILDPKTLDWQRG